MTEHEIAHWRKYALGMAHKLKRGGAPFTQEDIEDAEMEGLLRAMELDGHNDQYIGTAVGNVVRNMADRLKTRGRDVRLADYEKKD